MQLRSLMPSECTLMSLLAVLCGIAAPLFAQSGPAFAHERDVQTTLVTPRQPKWSGSTLVAIDRDDSPMPVIHAIDREGEDEQIALDLPGAQGVHVLDYTAGFDASIAVIGSALSADSRYGGVLHFLVWISPDRKHRTVTRLSPYVAEVVTIAGDGTIWTVGAVRTENPDRSKAEGNILKRFDTSGKVLSSVFPNARARAGISPDAVSLSFLVASRDRVGWFTNGNQFVEFTLDGRELNRFDGPARMDVDRLPGVAYDSEDGLFVGDMRDGRFQLLKLNRSKRTWQPVSLTWPNKPNYSRIVGFDGTTLITAEHSGTMHRHARTLQAANGVPKP